MLKNIIFALIITTALTATCQREIDRMKDQDATQRADSVKFTRQDTTDLDIFGTDPELYINTYDTMTGKQDTIYIKY